MSFRIGVAHTLCSDSQKGKVEDLAPSLHQALPLGELVLLPQASSAGPPAPPQPPMAAHGSLPKGSLGTSSLFHVILSLGSAFFPGRIGACDLRGIGKPLPTICSPKP